MSVRIQKLIALFTFGVIVFNGPFLSLFNSQERVLGIPVLFLYLFSMWAVLILLIGLIIEYRQIKPTDKQNP